MTVTVRVNSLTLSHKGSGGLVRSTFPDVCKSPVYPVPYTNTAYSATLAKGTTTVFADGGNMISVQGSEYTTSVGDEPGTGGGVISGVHMDRATWLSWSPTVFMQGRAVCRHSDKMLLNRGNTASLGGDQEPPLTSANKNKVICAIACQCLNTWRGRLARGQTYERCVQAAVKAMYYAPPSFRYPDPNKSPSLWAEVPFNKGTWDMVQAQPPKSGLADLELAQVEYKAAGRGLC